MKIYITSTFDKVDQVRAWQDVLVVAGHIITYDWTQHGDVSRLGIIRRIARNEIDIGVADADAVIALLPGSQRTFAQIGAALALDKPVILCADSEAVFNPPDPDSVMMYHHTSIVARLHHPAIDSILSVLDELDKQARVAIFHRSDRGDHAED